MRRSWVLITLFVAACGSSKPSAPSTGSSGSPISITGLERIGWDQPASDESQLASLQYAIYVDNARNELTSVSCTSTVGQSGFPCSGQLPPLSVGSHKLEIAAFSAVGSGVIEGNRSTPIQVIVGSAISAEIAPPETNWQSGTTEPTSDGLTLRFAKVAEQLDRPIDAAFAPDGRLFIVERGQVRIFSNGVLQSALGLSSEDPSQLVSIAFDPDFDRTRFVFLLESTTSRDGPVAYLTRYRELRGTLGERAVLLQTEIDSNDLSAVMRFGADGKLYLVVGRGDGTGHLFRVNADGTMPRDQAGTTPAIAAGVAIATGLAWDPRAPVLWIVDNDSTSGHLSAVSMSPPPVRAVVRARNDLPPRVGSTVFYTSDALPPLRNNALIASTDGYILRVRFAEDDPTRVEVLEKLLENKVGPVRVVTAAADGSIYFCTDSALGRISATR